MAVSRRKMLGIIGGGTILAAGATGGVFLSTRTPHAALKPWQEAGTYNEPRKRALSYAILAPNPHNRQPWEVDLSTPDQVVIHRDKNLNLPHTDPYDRQLTIGMGCFVEQLSIAASETGHEVEFDFFPQGDEGPVAIATFKEGGSPDPLAKAIMARRSCKEPFEPRAIGAVNETALQDYAGVVTDEKMVTALRDLTWAAWLTETHTPRTMKESVDLMRFGKSEINANPDGIDLGGPLLETLMLLGMVSRSAQLDPSSTGFKEGVKIYSQMLAATPAYATIVTKGNTRLDQIEAGRKWLRLNLKTTELGLALHPVSQALQEFPEMSEHYAKAHELLAKPGETVQMLGRLGYGPSTPQTPRWPLDKKMTNA